MQKLEMGKTKRISHGQTMNLQPGQMGRCGKDGTFTQEAIGLNCGTLIAPETKTKTVQVVLGEKGEQTMVETPITPPMWRALRPFNSLWVG
ncbi:MAG: hypothetical protein AB1457_13045 [Chloroflexota bacterium]